MEFLSKISSLYFSESLKDNSSSHSAVIILKRAEAIAVLKELLDKCNCLDGHLVEIAPPTTSKIASEGYQIIIRGALDGETQRHIKDIIVPHQLVSQVGSLWKTKRSLKKTEPDTLIIYRE